MGEDNRLHKYVVRSLSSRSLLVSLVLILSAMILPEVATILNLNLSKEVIYSFSSAFATAGIVSVLYNYITIEETREIIAETLLLNASVQKEILKQEKIEQLLDTSLTSVIGEQLKTAIKKTLLDNIREYRDVTRQSYVSSVVLRSFQSPPEIKQKLPELGEYLDSAFYKVEILSKFYEIFPNDIKKIKFVATSDDTKYNEIIKKYSKSNTLIYVYYLPGGISSVLNNYREIIENDKDLLDILSNCIFDIKDLRISKSPIENGKINKKLYFDKAGITIEIEIPIEDIQSPQKSPRFIQVDYQVVTILGKFENVFYQEFVRPYSSIDLWFDYEETDIIWAEPYISFTSVGEPTVQRSTNTKKVHVFIDEWVLPHSMIVFVLQRDECGLLTITEQAGDKDPCKEFYKWAFTEVLHGNSKYNLEWLIGLEEDIKNENAKDSKNL